MNKSITRAVLFTVRDIERKKIFEGESPQPSKPLIDFFVNLNDNFSNWLNKTIIPDIPNENEEDDSSILEKFKTIPDEVKKQAEQFEKENEPIKESSSLIDSITTAKNLSELRAIKQSFAVIYNLAKGDYNLLFNYLQTIPDESLEDRINKFTIKDYNETLAQKNIDADETHCDKMNPKVRDRLGWYRKEDGNTVICATYPWIGLKSSDHNLKWARALILTIIENYSNLDSILLVCHARDFNGFSGKDEVVDGEFFKDLQELFKKLKGLVVFQHNNTLIKEALNKSNAKDVYEEIKNIVEGYKTIKKADDDNENAIAHSSFMVKKKEGELN